MENDNENVKVGNTDTRKKSKKPKYKTSRVIIVIIALIAALAVIFGAGKFVLGLMAPESPEIIAANHEAQIASAKTTLGENIIYVSSTFIDSDDTKYKGMAFLSEEDLLFIGDKGFEKRISLDFIQDVAVSESSNNYDIAITDEDGSIYKLTKVEKNDEAEGFVVILTR